MIHRIMLALPFAALLACSSSGSSTGIQTVSCPPDSTLTYASFGKALIEAHCLECHGGKERPNLSTQAAVQAHTDAILDNAVYTDAMPEGRTMALSDREMLGEWLACGAP